MFRGCNSTQISIDLTKLLGFWSFHINKQLPYSTSFPNLVHIYQTKYNLNDLDIDAVILLLSSALGTKIYIGSTLSSLYLLLALPSREVSFGAKWQETSPTHHYRDFSWRTKPYASMGI